MRRGRRIRHSRKIKSINYGASIEGMETKKRISKWVLGGILLVICLAIGVGGYMYWQHQEEMLQPVTMELGDPSLPRIVSMEADYQVNELLPYTTEMDILTMRDTISPLTPQGNLEIKILTYGWDISKFSYTVLSSDGTTVLKEGILTEWEDDTITLSLSSAIPSVEESLIKMSLTLSDGRVVYYYTRTMTYNSCYMENNLNFIARMHADIMLKDSATLSAYFSEDTISSSLQELTLDSGLDQITWGSLSPTIIGEVKWSITECTSLFLSVQLEYRVAIESEIDSEETSYYNIVESYRVGYSSSSGEVQLKQYNRTMNQIFQTDDVVILDDGISLGITDMEDISYKVNEDDTAIAFVQERALYLYQVDSSEIISIFSLEEINPDDTRNRNNEYDIEILSIDENGSIAFVVYGYINRGENEGKVGSTIYYYDALTKSYTEKAFVASTQSFAVGQNEMNQGIYYSSTQDYIYIIAQGSFYEVDLLDDSQTILAQGIDSEDYEVSEDGKFIAYITESDTSSVKCRVLDLETGEFYSITAGSGEYIMPLGFMNQDFIYGVYTLEDTLLDEGDAEITPMYKIEIRDAEGKVEITYENENQYIRDVSIVDNMLTMNLVEVVEEQYVYAGQDVITNNEVQVVAAVGVSSYTSEQKLQQVMLSLGDSFSVENLTIDASLAQMIKNEESIKISYNMENEEGTYYAYAYGELQVISTMASDAIQYASANVGAVINEKNEYVWRSGNRDLTYTVSDYSDIASRMSSGETAIEIVSAWANQNPVSYTGCTTEQMCYIINQGQVIAAKLEDDSWIMLIGYTGDTMYYLNENGVKQSITMTTLDKKVIELIGDGIF